MYVHPAKTENKPDAAPPERVDEHADFASAMAAAVFGNNYPHPSSDFFRDRAPDAQVPEAAALRFKRARKRLPSRWMAR